MAAPSTQVKTNTYGTLTLRDGTGTPVTLALTYDKGDISISNMAAELNEMVPIERRGKLIAIAHGGRMYPEFSFTAFLGNIVGSDAVAPGTLIEFMGRKGAYSGNVSTLGSGTVRPYTVDLIWDIEGTNFGDTADERIVAEDCRCVWSVTEAQDGNTVSISGTVYGNVVSTNNTNTVTLSQIA
jgi:hypothetical protein